MHTSTSMLTSILALALAACGGGSSDAPVTVTPVDAPLADPGLDAAAAAFADTGLAPAGDQSTLRNMVLTRNESGFAATFSKSGLIDRTSLFFQSLGANGRSCASCHVQEEGWTITPRGVQARFEKTEGTDPVFRLVDGSNSPLSDVSTLAARRQAYGMLLSKGLIRVGIGIQPDSEFELIAVDDPYGFASAKELSLFRRPLPATNVAFLSTVMWDGRETFKDAKALDCTFGTTNCFASLHFSLDDQSNAATVGHAEGTQPLTAEQRKGIVDFEMTLFTAQVFDRRAGQLTAQGARGGPLALSGETFYFGINDTLDGDYRTRVPFSPLGMTAYNAWTDPEPDASFADSQVRELVRAARGAIARGQALFNGKSIQIRGVSGLNDDLNVATINGTCTTCHNAPNVGNHSVPLPLDIGVADASRRTLDMPLYTLRNKTTGETVQRTDPGRALISGKWKDIARFKGPILRGLAGRAPYFHNGSAKDLDAVVEFYDTRFGIGLTADEKNDLVAFLRTL